MLRGFFEKMKIPLQGERVCLRGSGYISFWILEVWEWNPLARLLSQFIPIQADFTKLPGRWILWPYIKDFNNMMHAITLRKNVPYEGPIESIFIFIKSIVSILWIWENLKAKCLSKHNYCILYMFALHQSSYTFEVFIHSFQTLIIRIFNCILVTF